MKVTLYDPFGNLVEELEYELPAVAAAKASEFLLAQAEAGLAGSVEFTAPPKPEPVTSKKRYIVEKHVAEWHLFGMNVEAESKEEAIAKFERCDGLPDTYYSEYDCDADLPPTYEVKEIK